MSCASDRITLVRNLLLTNALSLAITISGHRQLHRQQQCNKLLCIVLIYEKWTQILEPSLKKRGKICKLDRHSQLQSLCYDSPIAHCGHPKVMYRNSLIARCGHLQVPYHNSLISHCGQLQAVCHNPYPTAFPYGNGMVLHFYQQQESSTTKTVHKVINKGLKAYV